MKPIIPFVLFLHGLPDEKKLNLELNLIKGFSKKINMIYINDDII